MRGRWLGSGSSASRPLAHASGLAAAPGEVLPPVRGDCPPLMPASGMFPPVRWWWGGGVEGARVAGLQGQEGRASTGEGARRCAVNAELRRDVLHWHRHVHGLQATPPMARAAQLFEGARASARPPRGASSALRVGRDAEARRQLHGPSQLLLGTEATAAERGADCSGLPTPVPTSACTGARPGSGALAAPAPSDAVCAANRESNQGDVHLERLVFHEGPSWNGGNRSKCYCHQRRRHDRA
jgi:hypothetical protein